MKFTLPLAVALLTLAGCANMERGVINYHITQLNDTELLGFCGFEQQDRAKAYYLDEAERRRLITPEEREDCANGTIRTGMRRNALLASWGRPEGINTSGGIYGSSEQWVYGLSQYVYLDDEGRIESWQQSR